jgi:hypothetical protein
VRVTSSRAETFEPLKKGCGVWLSKRSAKPGRACQGSAAGLVLGVLARAAACNTPLRIATYIKRARGKYSQLYIYSGTNPRTRPANFIKFIN